MSTKLITSRDFNEDADGAKSAANDGPVYIIDRGRPSHVLLTFEDYQRLSANAATIIELLAHPSGVEAVEFHAPKSADAPIPAEFD